MPEVKNLSGNTSSILAAIAIVIVAYAAGRWQMNKAGAVLDKMFNNYPTSVSGLTLISAGIFTHELLPDELIPKLTVFMGLVQILTDIFAYQFNEDKASFGRSLGKAKDSGSDAVAAL